MVVVRVRETYDLHTVQNKMTVIGIHTPKPDIIKKNFPGLLMQCRAYRPLSADVVISCASVLPLDPLAVGTSPGDVSPEDVFNPILYSAISNKGMSQLEARINAMNQGLVTKDVDGSSAFVDVDDLTNQSDEFNTYYGLLSNSHGWKKSNVQSGVVMRGLRPLVYEMLYNVGDETMDAVRQYPSGTYPGPDKDGGVSTYAVKGILGHAKPHPFINCTAYTGTKATGDEVPSPPGFSAGSVGNVEQVVPYLNVICGAIIIPPSRLHEIFFRMTVSWEIEFSSIRPIGEITSFDGLAVVGAGTHYQNYSYSSAKKIITGDEESIMDKDVCMVSSNVEVKKVM